MNNTMETQSIASQRSITSADQKMENSEGEEEHPLFMTGLPSSFSTNKGLAALATLMEDDEEKNNNENESSKKSRQSCAPMVEMTENCGGGKISRVRTKKIASPYYLRNKQKKAENKANVSEAQLFLSLWKL